MKFNELLANCAICSTTLDLAATATATATANELSREGWNIDPDDLATVSPYITSTIRRFSDWILDLSPPADVGDGHLSRRRGSRPLQRP
ncbi:hypothetical protein Acy02nite_47390 [Actinoplanes cyaneus]|uniref:Tn3 transposase DDE domain-containing protein n=1 Tax=Actinoplanes cyaneus TaxID=52696 RepID=A0A919IK23_9ACTN|nr:hypothetical protein [Actinoplanes cyaneus]GID66858.1 hypothetical protein Acy02nite_47390 [Actinoplanes cyaneus]